LYRQSGRAAALRENRLGLRRQLPSNIFVQFLAGPRELRTSVLGFFAATDLVSERGVPVHTAWDIGHRHSTAIWFFQVVGPEVRIIDFYENHGQYADHYCSVVSARGYRRGNDYVPHDARVHEWGTGKTRLETLIALGRKRARAGP
jgi:hypothetical protein